MCESVTIKPTILYANDIKSEGKNLLIDNKQSFGHEAGYFLKAAGGFLCLGFVS